MVPGSSSSRSSTGSASGSSTTRYRCTACGNLTRFDVVATRRTQGYHHYSVGGELVIEDEEVLEETIEQVSCRWCGSAEAVQELDVLDAHGPAESETPPEVRADEGTG